MRILSRAFKLLLHPAAEWRSIAAEPATVSELLGYATVLAAIPAIAGFIGYSVVGVSLGIHAARLRMPIGPGIERAVVVYVLWVAGVYVAALLVRAIAPRFEGRSDLVTGLKVAVHAPTAVWIAGIFALIPPIGILTLLGLYSVYTLAIGLPIVTGCPPDESVWFVGAIVLCYLVVAILVAVIGGMIVPGFAAPAP